MVSHFNEFLNLLYGTSDYCSGRVFEESDIFSGPVDLNLEDIPYLLQLYGDYVLGLVKDSFPNWPCPVGSFVENPQTKAFYEERYWLYFTTTVPINDEIYEVVLEKIEFADGRLAKNRADFNRKTSQLTEALANKLNNLGSDDDRKIGIALPSA